ncbi:MAG TPA: PilX N-terminal domain-containing pilus assembly protein, partial [Planctomycetota bacterium]|nr:PilX N-terminal domain-containing pilus assembly protein [Planctomycetota bacterium]
MALIVVLALTALLALLAVSFATMAGVDRRVSRNYLDAVRARLVAESGVEAAVARLEERILRGALWTDVSWSVADGKTIHLDGDEVKDAGFLGSGSRAENGDFYRVRITDAQSRIHVNDGAPGGPEHSVSRNLRRILNILGAQTAVNVPGLGDKFLRSRPSTGYATVYDLLSALDGDRDAFERVRPFVTVAAWSDRHVCNPVPLSAETAGQYALDFPRPHGDAGPVYRYGHQKNWRGDRILAPLLFFDPRNPDPAHHAVWGRDSLNPQWIEIVGRAPVNVNTAPREVLMALVTDLEGFLLVERRRDLTPSGRGAASSSPCASPGAAYSWTSLRYRYDGRDQSGDECGLLYRTLPFTGPGGRSRAGIPASAVVDEIVACRERRASPGSPGLNYAAVPFGGPFGSWAQFNLFVDELVERGVLADKRAEIFWDLDESGRPVPASPHQLRAASQAIGDVLKANFNPNLHLNELNPDRTLFAHVDKTDLIVHSTEFCFSPMGLFEIESDGCVTRPVAEDAFETVAVKKVVALVKLFDAVRETSQSQFTQGEFPKRRASPETNNNCGLESGPEPDNGPAPSEGHYEGYLQLPTLGSNLADQDTKPPGELWTTMSNGTYYPGAKTTAPGGSHMGSVIHAHFQYDFVAHHHASRNGITRPPWWDGFRLPLGAWQSAFGSRGTLLRNWGDRTETLPSPYGPVDSTRAGSADRYRLARSFSGTPPAGAEAAPSDLRVDGAYLERDSAFGYWIDENISFNFNEGTAAFWFKPAFTPESTGKRRTLLSVSRYHATRPEFMNPSPFGLFFVPPHGGESELPPTYAAGLTRFPSSSLAFGFGFSSATGYSWEMGGTAAADKATDHAFVFSPTLNRDGRGPLRAHEWTHVAVTWDNPRNRLPNADTVRIHVNGRILPGTVGMTHVFAQEGQPFGNAPWWGVHSLQAMFGKSKNPGWVKNTIRLGGEPSKFFDLPGEAGLFPANFSADGTFDEFYLWMNRGNYSSGGTRGLQELWSRGRYYRADDRDPEDAKFTSAPVELRRTASRNPDLTRHLLGVAWTEIAPDYDRTGSALRPKLLDASENPPLELRPAATP